MPTGTGVTQTPYPTVGQIMNLARAYVNDAFRGGQGRILTNQAPFTVQYLNGALGHLQDKIGNNAITLIKDNVILTPITQLPGPNPATQIYISFQGFFNGTIMVPQPVLPSDCRTVLEVWERQTGSGLQFVPMTQPMYGLPSTFQTNALQIWEWRQDRINMLGSMITEDIRIRYESRLPFIAPDSSEDDWNNTQINILSSENAMAHIVAYFYARARGAQAAASLKQDADEYIHDIVNRYVRRDQATPFHREPYGGGRNNGGAQGAGYLPGS